MSHHAPRPPVLAHLASCVTALMLACAGNAQAVTTPHGLEAAGFCGQTAPGSPFSAACKEVVVPLGHGYAFVYLVGFDSRAPCASSTTMGGVSFRGRGWSLSVCYTRAASLDDATMEAIRVPVSKQRYECIPALVYVAAFAECSKVRIASGVASYGARPGP